MFEPQEPQEQTFTKWKNPTQDVVRADVFTGHPSGPSKSPRVRYKFSPGEVKQIPSEYDDAIQTVRSGQIVGGLAPQLERVGVERLPYALGLDPNVEPEPTVQDAAQEAAKKAVEGLATALTNALEQRDPKAGDPKPDPKPRQPRDERKPQSGLADKPE